MEDLQIKLEKDPNTSMAIHQSIRWQHKIMERQENNLRRALQNSSTRVGMEWDTLQLEAR